MYDPPPDRACAPCRALRALLRGQGLLRVVAQLASATGVPDVWALEARLRDHDSVLRQARAIELDTRKEIAALQVLLEPPCRRAAARGARLRCR
jgi:hypothetical protein